MSSKQTLVKWDKQYLWHPFTQMKEWFEEEIIIVERGEGIYLIDVDGKHYIDGISSMWTNVHGHRNQEIDDALKGQIDKISHSTLLGYSNVPQGLKGLGITMILTGLISMAYLSFSGIDL